MNFLTAETAHISLSKATIAFQSAVASVFEENNPSIRGYRLYGPLQSYLDSWITVMSEGLNCIPEVEQALASFNDCSSDTLDLDSIYENANAELRLQVPVIYLLY
jgi:hypothetical protein